MPILANARRERFAQILAGPHPPNQLAAYRAAGFNGDASHAYRCAQAPEVANRIAELKAIAGKLVASQLARAEAAAISKVMVTRQSLLQDSMTAYKLAESEVDARGMIQALRFMAELSQISLKAPEDKQQPAQHLHLHEQMIDRPPTETLEQWIDRKRQEAETRTTKRLKVVGSDDPDHKS